MDQRSPITQNRFREREFFGSVNYSATAQTDYITTGCTTDPSLADWSLLIWARLDRLPYRFTPGRDHNLYSQQNGTGFGRSWLFYDRTNNNSLASFFGGVGTVSSYVGVRGWHRHVLTFNHSTSTITFYVDGVLISSHVVTIESATGFHVIANNKSAALGGMFGNIADVRFMNRKLTDDEISIEYTDGILDETDTDYHLNFSNAYGTTISDGSGNAKHATMTSGGIWQVFTPSQKKAYVRNQEYSLLGKATGVVGGTDYVDLVETTDPSTTDWTLSLWYNARRLPREVTIPGIAHNIYNQLNGSGTGLTWLLIRNTNHKLSTLLDGSGTAIESNYTMEKGLHCIHLTWDFTSHQLSFYVNGKCCGRNTVVIPSADGNHRLLDNKIIQGPADGYITETRFYTRKFADAEVDLDYFKNIRDSANLRYELLFSDGSGTVVSDSSGSGRNGTITGATWSDNVASKPREPIAILR